MRQFIALLLVAASLSVGQPAVADPIASDDFSAPNLNNDLWTFVDPVGDAAVSISNGNLVMSVGAGVDHDVWLQGNRSARILQSADNVNFEVEVKFSSMPSKKFQTQGILVEQDATRFFRFDIFSNGTELRAFSASFANGGYSLYLNRPVVLNGPDTYLRLTRSGNTWVLALSENGSSWSSLTSFSFAMNVTGVGPFVGNAGSNPPAFSSVVDYFFNTASPIIPEDGGSSGPDTTPPLIVSDSVVAIADTEVRISWTTDEPADALVEYGLTTGYELGSLADANLTTAHDFSVDGLTPNSNYHFRITTTDASGNSTVSDDYLVSTSAVPTIDVWYGDTQTFGLLGQPQWAANVLGKISDPDGIAAATYSLNGGQAQPLNLGPDGKRLANQGDFNIELQFDDLAVGSNSVSITATDSVGIQAFKTVIVNYPGFASWPGDYSVDWSTISKISDAAQVVDGKWRLENGTVRTVELGYDRIIAVGDDGWQDYEITVEMIANGIDPACSQSWCAGGGAVLGILTRWPGHQFWGRLPHHGWYPMGALAAFAWKGTGYMEMYRGSDGKIVQKDFGATFQLGVPHIFKMRAETLASVHRYSAKLWPAGQPEPASWSLVLDEPLSETGSGSALIVAHHVDVSVGDISVVQIDGSGPPLDTTPPAISNVQVSAISETQATVTWQTNEPASRAVAYGQTSSYEDGTVSGSGLATNHSVTLTGLAASTQYHFQVISADASSNTSSSSDAIFTTTGSGGSPGNITSDEFTGSLDTGLWTFVDPRGDSSVGTTGSQLSISVPAGPTHDIWSKSKNAPRVLQSISDSDFEIEVKFDSPLTQGYQMQGIVAQQDSNNLIRFDFHHDGSQTRIFAAQFQNGAGSVKTNTAITSGNPLYMSVSRAGNLWTLRYSYDGFNWITAVSFTKALSVSDVGVFGGNYSPSGNSAPAHTALIDYFRVIQ